MKIPDTTNCFTYYNMNPKNRKTGDCVIRALAFAMGKTWEEVLSGLYEVAVEVKSVPNDIICYEKYLASQGWIKQNQPRKADNTKYTGDEYCTKLTVNSYIAKGKPIIAHIGGHHVVAIALTNVGDDINDRYKIHDTWDSSSGCIGNFWIKL